MQSVDFEQQHKDEKMKDPLEDTPLAERLRAMEWPSAPPEVKERCFERILAEIEDDA